MKRIFNPGMLVLNGLIWLLVFMLPANSILAQAGYQSSVSNIGNAANATINKPAATGYGDLLLVGITFEKGSSEVVTPPSGWTLIRRTDNDANCGIATYYKVAGAAEPASYSFALLNGSKWSIGISRITNAASSPIEISAGSTGLGATATAPSVTTIGARRLVVCFYTNKKSSTYIPDASTTERYDQPNTDGGLPSNMMATFIQAGAGATGNRNAAATDPESWAAQQIAITPLSILPVKFESFQVLYHKDARIQWSASEDKNAAYYDVQRSDDGTNWKVIGTIQAAGSTSSVKHYSYIDKEVFGSRIFYRIKQVDHDGNTVFTTVKSINVESSAAIQVSNSSNKIAIKFNQKIKGQVYVQVVSMNGQTFSTQLLVDPSGQVLINALSTLKGYFIVSVSDKKQVYTAKQVLF